MDNVGYAALQIIPSFKGFEGKLDSGTRGAMTSAGVKGGTAYGEAAGKSAGSRFNRIFVGAAKLGLAGVIGGGVAAFKLGKDAIAQASDLNESLNAVNVTYDKQATAVKKLGREAAESLGLSNTEFNGLAVQFSAFATQVAGGEGPKVVKILDQLTTRGSDFASVMNLDVNEAMGLFQSGLAGETEPLRKFGIDLSAARVEAFAYAHGIAKGGEELTESQKVQARYGALMEQTAKTQGDFANTSDQLANSQRILSARWDNAQAKLGKALLPIMTDLVNLLLEKGIPAVEKFGDWFSDKGIGYLEKFGGYAADAAGFVKDMVGAFNDLPNPAKLAGLTTVLGGAAALKLRGGGGGLLGTAGSVLGAAKPVPVFVTNPGFSAGAPGAGGVGGAGKAPVLLGAGITAAFATFAGLGTGYANNKLGDAVGPEAASGIVSAKANNSGGLGTPFTADDFREESAQVTSIFGDLVKKANSTTAAMLGSFATLPKTILTRFDLLGVPESKAEAQNLAKVYNLTPKEKRTLFEGLGFAEAQSKTQLLIKQYNQTPATKRTNFELGGIDLAQAKLARFTQDLAQVRDKTVTVNTVFTSSGRRFKEFSAGGGVSGPGTGTSDDIPALLSNGEHVWTAREVANAGGHGAVEALRRRFRYANGGPVGSPRVSVGGASVRVFIDGREIRDIAVEEGTRAANRVVNAQLAHEHVMGG